MNYRERQLRSEIKKLQERNGLLSTISTASQEYLNLEQENKDKEYEITSLKQEVKSQEEVLKGIVELLGKEIKDPTDLKNFLKGRTLKEWLDHYDKYLEKKDQDYQTQKDKLIQERSEVKEKLGKSKERENKLIKDFNQLETVLTRKNKQIGKWEDELAKIFAKYDIRDDHDDPMEDLDDLRGFLKEWSWKEKQKKDFLTEHKAKNYEEVSQKITKLEKDNQSKETKISQQEKQSKDGEKAFSEIVEVIKPKMVIFKGKKIVKERLSNLKTVMSWNKTDTEGISEEE